MSSNGQDNQVGMLEVPKKTIWVYGSVSLPLAIMSLPLAVWLPRLYASEMNIDLSLVGYVIALAVIFDAISDPVMGFLSDKTQTPWGKRKPWILLGMPVYMFAVYMLLNPSLGISIYYLAGFYILYRVSTTLLGLPYGAWGMELSSKYHTRTLIQSVREKYVLIGLFTAAVIMFMSRNYWNQTSASFILSNFSMVVLIILPITVFFLLWKVPEVPAIKGPKLGMKASLNQMVKNKLFFRLLVIEVLIAGGENFRNFLSLFFIQDYIGASDVGLLYMIYFGVGFTAIPFWDFLARRIGKHKALATAMVLVSAVSIACFMLEFGQVYQFYFLYALKGFCFGSFAYIPRAMLADVVDLDTIRSGAPRPASYFSIHGFMTKLAASLGALSLPILAYVGFSAAPDAVNGPAELQWLGILYAIVPTVLFVVAFYLCITWPLNAEVHKKVQRLVEKRLSRQAKLSHRGTLSATLNTTKAYD